MTEAPDFDSAELPTLCPEFHHINLKTNRLQEMIDWYAAVVGSHVTFQRHDCAFVTNDAANHRVALNTRSDFTEPEGRETHIGMHHSAFQYRSLDELLMTWVRLKGVGILPARCINHGPTTSFYYRDPDGNQVELQADNWDNSLQSGIFMRDDPRFREDPSGQLVDPALLVQARRDGLSPWDIHVAAYRGDFAPERAPDRAPW